MDGAGLVCGANRAGMATGCAAEREGDWRDAGEKEQGADRQSALKMRLI